MATFKQDPEEWQRLDFRLLQNSAVSLYFSSAVLEADVSWFAAQAYRVFSLRTDACASAEDLLIALGELLSFPEYFGRNLDAFNDCLSDIEVPDVGGVLLVLRDFDSFAAANRSDAQALLDICADNSRRFLLSGQRFLVLVHSKDPRIAFDPVGATPVMWNPQEWSNANRGL